MQMNKRTGPGRWWVFSVTNPDWNGEGVSMHLDEDAADMPTEAASHIEAMADKLQGMPPEDIDYGFEINH